MMYIKKRRLFFKEDITEEEKSMKKIILLLLLIIMGLGSAACAMHQDNPMQDSPEVLASIRTSDEADKAYDPALQEREDNI
ncbi:MAG: hypothetical protein EOM67_14765, partial [Spirochaetia bacterium]|nr:hypothetical protein [Spirochaetia bacterium]